MTLKLHVFPPSPRAFKVMAVASYLKLDYEICVVDMTQGMHRSPEFTALNPNQRMPVMEDNGFVLWESNAILQHLAAKCPESGLLPADPEKRALVNQWQFWDMAHWDPACAILIFENHVKTLFKLGTTDAARVAEGEQRFHREAKVLDAHLGRRPFVVGEEVTIADFALGSALNLSRQARMPLENYPNITRWHAQLTALPGWRKSLVNAET